MFSSHFRYPPGYFVQNLQMDFFNYAGLHRPVKLYTTPTVYLSDITVTTDFRDDEGLVTFDATVGAMDKVDEDGISTLYELFDANDNKVAEVGKSEAVFKGILNVSDVHLWWPIGMNSEVGYLYKLKVYCLSICQSHNRRKLVYNGTISNF